MSPSPRARELDVAVRAVHRASVVTKTFLHSLHDKVSAETKADASPVTVADFAAQALIISALHAVFPTDSFLGEESAAALRANHGLRARVWELVSSAPTVDGELASPDTVDAMLDAIDLGTGDQTATGRVWVLDPIDGTATFVKGQQYTVCLCLLVDRVQQVGVVGCPNLDPDSIHGKLDDEGVDRNGYGVVLSAVKGDGAFVRPMQRDSLGCSHPIEPRVQGPPMNQLDFVESTLLAKTSLSQQEHRAVAEHLGASWPGTQLWSLQLKYVALALGASDVMVRIPTGRDRYTYIWDHAGGQLIYQEAGGVIKDLDGKPIDFGQGRKLCGERNYGAVAAMPWAFDTVMQAVQVILEKRKG